AASYASASSLVSTPSTEGRLAAAFGCIASNACSAAARGALAIVLGEVLLAHADFFRGDFDQLVIVDEVQCLLQRELGRRGQLDRVVLARGAHVGQRLGLDGVDGEVVVL